MKFNNFLKESGLRRKEGGLRLSGYSWLQSCICKPYVNNNNEMHFIMHCEFLRETYLHIEN